MFKIIAALSLSLFAVAAGAQQGTHFEVNRQAQAMRSTPGPAQQHHHHQHRPQPYNGDYQYPNGQWKPGYGGPQYAPPVVVYPQYQPAPAVIYVQPARPGCVPYYDQFKRHWVAC